MKGDVRLYSVSVIGAYLPFFEGLRKKIVTYSLPFSGWENRVKRAPNSSIIYRKEAIPAYFALAKITK